MRIKSFMLTACMAAVLASCAKDENLENGGSPSFQSGDGYISVAFSFPSDVRTRANGEFADGVGAESDIQKMAAYSCFWRVPSSKILLQASLQRILDLFTLVSS